LHFELEILESLVLSKLNPSAATSIPNKSLMEYDAVAFTESSKIKMNLFKSVFELKKDQLIEIYIHRHHKHLIFLADNLHEFLNSNRQTSDKQTIISDSIIKSWETVYHIIDDLLLFIENHFSKYINLNEKIPERLKQSTICEFNECLTYIEQFKNYQTTSLIEIAVGPVVDFTVNEKDISFAQLFYLKELTKQFVGFEKQTKVSEYGIFLKKRLFHINFNDLSFLYYLTGEILQVINSFDSLPDKIEKLFWYTKITNQFHINPELAYIPRYPSIKVLLLQWLEDEIFHREKSFKPKSVKEDSFTNSDFKLETDLSVDQYAFLIRVLTEVGVYKNKSKTKLADFFAKNTNTKRVNVVSSRNLRNNFYGTDTDDREVIKNVAIKMLNYIKGLNVLIPLLYISQADNFLVSNIIPLTS
jgi:hypothetical protein